MPLKSGSVVLYSRVFYATLSYAGHFLHKCIPKFWLLFDSILSPIWPVLAHGSVQDVPNQIGYYSLPSCQLSILSQQPCIGSLQYYSCSRILLSKCALQVNDICILRVQTLIDVLKNENSYLTVTLSWYFLQTVYLCCSSYKYYMSYVLTSLNDLSNLVLNIKSYQFIHQTIHSFNCLSIYLVCY